LVVQAEFITLSSRLAILGRYVAIRPSDFGIVSGFGLHIALAGSDAELLPKVHVIRVGTARQRDQLVPKVQLWCRSSQIWLNDLSTVPKIEKQPVFDQRGGMECTT